MAETAIKLFADLTNLALVNGIKGGSFSLGSPFHQGKLYFQIQPLTVNPDGGNTAPYTVQDGSAYSLSAVVCKTDGTVLAGPVTSWSADGTALVGSIDLNTAAMVTAFTSSSVTEVPALIEFQFTDGSNGKSTVQHSSNFKIKRQYITSGTPSELALPSYLTRDECLALFPRFSGNEPGRTITLRNAADTGEVTLGCGPDNEFTTDSST